MTATTPCLRLRHAPWFPDPKAIDTLKAIRARTTNRIERHALWLAIKYLEAERTAFRARILYQTLRED